MRFVEYRQDVRQRARAAQLFVAEVDVKMIFHMDHHFEPLRLSIPSASLSGASRSTAARSMCRLRDNKARSSEAVSRKWWKFEDGVISG